jgi:hypothetical protein
MCPTEAIPPQWKQTRTQVCAVPLEIKAVLCTVAGDLKKTSRTFFVAGDIYNEGGPTCACVPEVAEVANVDHTKTARQHIDQLAKLQSCESNQQ